MGLAGIAALAVLLAGDAAHAQEDWPDSLRELFMEGVEAQKAGQLDVAEQAFLQVLREGGKAAFVYNNLGIIYQQRRDHAEAVAQFREAIRLEPDYAAPHALRQGRRRAPRNRPGTDHRPRERDGFGTQAKN